VNQIKLRYPDTPLLLLDSGNFSDNPTQSGDVKTAGLLQAMDQLGYEIVNVGERDIRMGYPEFARRTDGSPFTYISANIVDRKTKKPIFQPHAVVEVAAPDGSSKVKVGVIGVVRFNPVFLKAGPDGGNIIIANPLERVQQEIAALEKKKVDVVVLLAALHKNDARSIVRQCPEVDFVLGSYGGLVTTTEEQEGDTTILYCGNRGQRIGESRVFLDGGKQPEIASRQNKLHVLTRHYPPDMDMLNFVNSIPKDAPKGAPAKSSSVPTSGARQTGP
jgi:2',3'-cyclic-nucleotide 2'-phosphodiesterase/3'-nucleotidase